MIMMGRRGAGVDLAAEVARRLAWAAARLTAAALWLGLAGAVFLVIDLYF
jgi:hypothetical protein